MAGYNTELQKIIYHHVINSKNYLDKTKKEYFKNEHVRFLFQVVKQYFLKNSSIPKQSTLEKYVEIKKLTDKISISQIELIYEVDLTKYDEPWLDRITETFIKYSALEGTFKDMVEYVGSQDINEDNIESLVNNVIKNFNERNSINFTTDAGLEFFNPEAHLPDIHSRRLTTGYSYLDDITNGGMAEGELWLLMGRTNVGKSIWLSNFAKNFICNGHNTLYITLEMGEKDVLSRIGSNMFGIPIDKYYKNLDTEESKKRIKNFKNSHGLMREDMLGKLWIKQFPNASFSTLDLESFVRQNIEKYYNVKINCIVLDYLNLMSNWRNPNSEDTYIGLKKISEDLRSAAVANKWVIVTATQTNRGAYDKTDVDLKDISESAGVLHTSDYVAAIIQDQKMKNEDYYYLKTLKNRVGGFINTRKKFNINYEYMTLSESSEEFEQVM